MLPDLPIATFGDDPAVIAGFVVLIAGLLLVDLLLFARGREPTFRESVTWSIGWLLLAVLAVGMLLSWIWRFRPGLWHRDNVLILIGLLVENLVFDTLERVTVKRWGMLR